MNITPKTEDEVKSKFELIPEDTILDFEVLTAEEKTSSNLNDMIAINIAIYDGDLNRGRIYDYLMEKMAYKLRHFCDATGLLDKYQSGNLRDDDCIGRTGKCKIGVQKAKPDGNGGEYPAKNVIKDYVCRAAKPIRQQQDGQAAPINDDDLPF